MGANQEKLTAKMEAYPKRMESNQENIEAMVEHYKWVPHAEAFLPPCRARLPIFYLESLKE
jgi:hypothetical protein